MTGALLHLRKTHDPDDWMTYCGRRTTCVTGILRLVTCAECIETLGHCECGAFAYGLKSHSPQCPIWSPRLR